ncbi:MAG TPA: hypothetical protein PLS70_20175, partial [Acidobacteriota bacterium]|nr:hypothetical protein [Acidobacteriota bacterium]
GSVAMATVGQAKAQVVLGALAMATQDPEPTKVETCDELTPYNKEEDTFLSEIEERVLVGIQAESDLPSDENDDWEPPVQAEESVFWVVNLSTQTENEIVDSGGLNPDEFSGNAVNSDTLTTLSEIEERVLVGIQAESDLPSDENDDWEPPVQAEESVFWVDRLTTQTENEIIDSGGLNPDEFSGNAVNSDSLTTLENELELPPSTFQNELKFICEEPKETQRAFAHERYQKLRDHLEKCAPNFGFSDLRQKFRSIFGGAICDLLEKTNVPGSVEFLESS